MTSDEKVTKLAEIVKRAQVRAIRLNTLLEENARLEGVKSEIAKLHAEDLADLTEIDELVRRRR